MKEFEIPQKSSTSTGGAASVESEKEWVKVAIPETLSRKQEKELYYDFFERINGRIREIENQISDIDNKVKSAEELDKKVMNFENNIKDQANRNIEILGVFASVLALLIVDVNVIKAAPNFLSSILLIISLTCSIAVFASIIHVFFSPNDNVKFGWSFFTPIIILVLLVIVGIVSNVKGLDLNKNNDTKDKLQVKQDVDKSK